VLVTLTCLVMLTPGPDMMLVLRNTFRSERRTGRARSSISESSPASSPGTSAGAMLVLVCSMMLVSASFWVLFVATLDRPAIRRWIAQSQRTVHRVSGGLMLLLGVRVALAER
jgi:threonine/homoserine/homoserine lactone efflux protein